MGASLFMAITVLESYPNIHFNKALGHWAIFFFYGFVFCFIPGHLFNFAMESAARLSSAIARERMLYIATGAAGGTLCGLLIACLVFAPALMAFVGAAAGAATAALNFTNLREASAG